MNSKKSKYSVSTIQEMLAEAEAAGLGFYEKWEKIGAHYQVKPETVRKWWNRNRDQDNSDSTDNSPGIPHNGKISSDQWRTAYFILTGKISRGKIRILKRQLSKIIAED